jgi:hypothetical protein
MSDGGPAFPRVSRQTVKGMDSNGYAIERQAEVYFPGMTLRDYFAAEALQGMIPKEPWPWTVGDEGTGGPIPMLAKYAYLIADAMLAARTP